MSHKARIERNSIIRNLFQYFTLVRAFIQIQSQSHSAQKEIKMQQITSFTAELQLYSQLSTKQLLPSRTELCFESGVSQIFQHKRKRQRKESRTKHIRTRPAWTGGVRGAKYCCLVQKCFKGYKQEFYILLVCKGIKCNSVYFQILYLNQTGFMCTRATQLGIQILKQRSLGGASKLFYFGIELELLCILQIDIFIVHSNYNEVLFISTKTISKSFVNVFT
ncbi:Hypothetical_protein [Hexamita inflata]|uniref:Hypothetical_protein n=1 Tax=Hexamita inflata TaxID=28002 RepID=A0ABP1HQK5_9EUKA